MRSWSTDALVAVVEAVLDLLDAFLKVPARVYLLVSALVLAVILFASWGPHL